jgi:toxin CptA
MSMLDLPLIGLAMMLGFTYSKASLCAVACMKKVVVHRQFAALNVLGLAISASGLVLLLLALSLPQAVMLPEGMVPLAWSALGGVVLGVGSLVNGGCYLGSVTYLGSGNSNFLFTLVGIGAGLRLGGGLLQIPMRPASGLHEALHAIWIISALLFAGFIALTVWREHRGRSMGCFTVRGPWPVAVAACSSGLLGGMLYAFHPGWSYGTVIGDLVYLDQQSWNVAGNAAALGLLGGAILGTAISGRWHPEWPTLHGAARCLAGGTLMGLGAKMIPGGSDMLVLWSVPGLSSYGIVAFGAMLVTLSAGFAMIRLAGAT